MGIPTTSSRRFRAVLLLVLGLLVAHVHAAAAASPSNPLGGAGATTRAMAATTIQAVPDDTQLSSKGNQAGCDHYRNGYLGLAMCVNFYDDAADGQAYVQVVGSMTNEGQVDICNLTLSISHLETATYKNPAWLPAYPKTQSFKSGTYFPFTAILPMNTGTLASYRYPTVDVKSGFFACDAGLRALPEDQVVPPPGMGRSSIEADDDFPGSSTGSTGFGSKIRWAGFRASAGAQTECLAGCLANLNKQKDDCAGAEYVLQSGCLQNCPDTVLSWTMNACTKAKCMPQQCTLKTSKTSAAGRRYGWSLATWGWGVVVYAGLWALQSHVV